ncbi:MAG TPA: GntR family transcriptional regulator [Isosphaeraceae bacterium]|jgi:GntR family transcriptional regulator|nr:GntR family transcriptional regulator [Isosphaeraceae bacterium]
MIWLDADDPTPLYAQLERAIRAAIATGDMAVGAQLPTVRRLAEDLKINANTVAKVYGSLERAGVLETRRGVGTFVKDKADVPRADGAALAALAQRFLAEAAVLGYTVEDVIRHLQQRRGGHDDA